MIKQNALCHIYSLLFLAYLVFKHLSYATISKSFLLYVCSTLFYKALRQTCDSGAYSKTWLTLIPYGRLDFFHKHFNPLTWQRIDFWCKAHYQVWFLEIFCHSCKWVKMFVKGALVIVLKRKRKTFGHNPSRIYWSWWSCFGIYCGNNQCENVLFY